MLNLSETLKIATANINHTYFHLYIDGGAPVFRERVYCYELYHQLRSIWPKNCRYVLNGEVDKRAHPILSDLDADYAKPDLLIHGPGDMKLNHAIIEVKHTLKTEGVKKDIKTLDLFLRKVNYERAIYLIYGDAANSAGVRKINAIAETFSKLRQIEVWLHSNSGSPAEHVLTLGSAPDNSSLGWSSE